MLNISENANVGNIQGGMPKINLYYDINNNSLVSNGIVFPFTSELGYKPRYEYLYSDLTPDEQKAMDIANEFGIYQDGGQVDLFSEGGNLTPEAQQHIIRGYLSGKIK